MRFRKILALYLWFLSKIVNTIVERLTKCHLTIPTLEVMHD